MHAQHAPFEPIDPILACGVGSTTQPINCANFLKIGQGVSELAYPKNGISHWKRSSPLQQCQHYCAALWWVPAFLRGVLQSLVTTTNGLERKHEELKQHILANMSNGSLTDLVSAIVEHFVPQSKQKVRPFLFISYRILLNLQNMNAFSVLHVSGTVAWSNIYVALTW